MPATLAASFAALQFHSAKRSYDCSEQRKYDWLGSFTAGGLPGFLYVALPYYAVLGVGFLAKRLRLKHRQRRSVGLSEGLVLSDR